ncbi:replicative DNA helicase [Alistipes onderdonkii]|uniref:replicative DNA helicase n=1 Tax=Alistipes onderdonkii TaxID=328813 RepID=UPI00189AD042|nr:replicative DNA helicase [Alistipes onderdonkii]
MKREKQTSYNRPAPVEGLPESPELERAVLGALILEPGQLPDLMEIIGISAFSDPNNGKIYGEMLSMLERGDKIDLYTLSQRPELKGRDMLRYLSELTSVVGSGVNVLDHARHLADTETRRRLCLFGYELAARAVSDPDYVVDWAASEITAIADRVSRPDDIAPLSDVVRATLDDLERRQQARQAGECIGIPTGLQRLDALTGGWRGGQLIVLAGRPGTGKSATMLHFARAAAASGVPVCVFSLEMPAGQLAGRMLVGGSGVDSQAFRVGSVDTAGWSQLEQAGAELSAIPVYLNDRANITIGAIRSQCKAMHRRGKCGMVVIDYLQLLDTSTRNPNSTREREIAAASRAAKLLAKELDVPVILLSQLSRKVEERADKTPLLSDLRESGAIEQDADMVLFLDRPVMYGRTEIDAGRYGIIPAEGVGLMHITKHRAGATGCICFRHNESLTQISDCDGPATDVAEEAEPF